MGSFTKQNACFFNVIRRGVTMKSNSIVLLILIILISGCSSSNLTEDRDLSMLYDFNEPFRFPFEVNEVRTEIAMDNPYVLQQYVFHYKNKQSMQEIRYILSKESNFLHLKMGNKHITKRTRPVNQFGGKVIKDSWLDLFIISTEASIS
ncbi:hypothetical protein [Paenibacillus apii]|uniref:hypothetical protein n=1 Tax=Paenibacillus apii TaxID=1850370 RepID=UPI00143A4D1B|nr:hypothetical protein [Paenibacillus apii]NJJ38148.1 hypothetical protein [Paenibacillus apii]